MILFGIATSFYALNLICFAKALDWLPVSVGYPVLAAVGFLLLSVCSALLLGEKISSLQITGIVIIVVGIFVLARTNI
jgi:multidrug transporter EmrE-like cation transporter